MITTTSQILRRIRAKGRGQTYISKDFLDFGSRAAVDQALSRLVRKGDLRRLSRGIYDYPKNNPKLGDLTASPDAVAKSLAKKTNSHLQVSGAQAANLLGLSTQVPARIVYLTDGNSKRVRIGNQTIEFRHTSPRYMAWADKTSGMVLQALRYLGQKNIDDFVMNKLKLSLSNDDKADLKKSVGNAPGWMRPILTKVAM